MRVRSLMRQGFELVPIEVEVSLTSGLPHIHFLGLPDAAIRESEMRIKSAIRKQGYRLPPTKQILVNLHPTHLRKSSRGLDLAVAAAILWETEQVPTLKDLPIVYGELSLHGDVTMPDDLDDLDEVVIDTLLLSGPAQQSMPFARLEIRDLKGLKQPQRFEKSELLEGWQRPKLLDLKLSGKGARWAEVIAAGEHATLLAGPHGTGKTTMAEVVHALLADPSATDFRQSRMISKSFGRDLNWRPLIQPHHSIPPLSMIGGGSSPRPGEITRAHGGVLIMNEFLEFAPKIQEALREPIEEGKIRIARSGKAKEFPADVLLIATSNLCPCGSWSISAERCRCSMWRRRFYLSRLVGPFLDRFQLLFFTEAGELQNPNVPLPFILERVEKAVFFRREVRRQAVINARLDAASLFESLTQTQQRLVQGHRFSSRRRHDAVLRVARTLADLEQSHVLSTFHLDQAIAFSHESFQNLERHLEMTQP